MSLIKLTSVQKSFGSKVVLKDISFSLENGDRLALIGENGTGKTTLLRLIAKKCELDPESGLIEHAKTMRIGYLPQQLDQDDLDALPLENNKIKQAEARMRELEIEMSKHDATDANEQKSRELEQEYGRAVAHFESIGGYAYEHLLQEILPELGLAQLNFERPLSSFSGGEKMRLALAHLVLSNPDLLLLDEPTNHLDYRGIAWLANYLARYKGAVLLISHDRSFLDTVATRIGKLSYGKMVMHNGNYSHFVEIDAANRLVHERELNATKKALEHELEAAQTMLSHRKISQYHHRERRAKKLEVDLKILKEQTARSDKRLNFKLIAANTHYNQKNTIISGTNVEVAYEDGVSLFAPFSFQINSGDRIAICGPNGCGKTTLFKALLGRIGGITGELKMVQNIMCAELGQITVFENEDLTALQTMAEASPELNETALRTLLAAYGFWHEEVHTTVSQLSGGERARLSLAVMLRENPDLILLDEPTNHLDINTCEILERILSGFTGTILLISHDRYFVEKITNKVFGFVGKSVKTFETYAKWLQAATTEINTTPSKIKSEEPPKTSSKNRAKARQEVALRAKRIRQIEEDLTALGQKQLDFENGFATGDISLNTPQHYAEYASLLEDIDSLTNLYIELSEDE